VLNTLGGINHAESHPGYRRRGPDRRCRACGRRKLLKEGKAVRAMVRSEDERAQALRDMGAEVVVGNLPDLNSMHRAAIAGCETMYFGVSFE
jgi:hypothetical protein